MFRGLKSLITGIVAGTALGVLFSPKKGEEIRRNIKKEMHDGGMGLDTIKDTFTEMGKDLGDAAKEGYEELSKTDGFKKVEKALKNKTKNVKRKAKKIAKKQTAKAKKAVKKVAKKIKKK
ncbi:YtxH domain-containing protein [Candidatus Gracilibacteria bacterium]|nr:YtxH domain-containing protein [Candidatus Gracilibacteria bacterium]